MDSEDRKLLQESVDKICSEMKDIKNSIDELARNSIRIKP